MGFSVFAKKKLMFAIINWSSVFNDSQYDAQHTSLEFNVERTDASPCGWGPLVAIARNELAPLNSQYWPKELDTLRQTLIQNFNIGLFGLNKFDDNFALFTQFIYYSFNQGDIAPILSATSRQLDVDNDAHHLHVQYVFRYLLNYHVGSMLATTNMETLLERAEELKGLAALTMLNDEASPPLAPSMWVSLRDWLLNLFRYLKNILLGSNKEDDIPELYAELADNLWSLLQVCQIGMQVSVDGEVVRDLLYQSYQKSISHLSQVPLQTEIYFQQHRCVVETKTEIHSFSEDSIESLKNAIHLDLKTLTHWANSHFRCAILKFQTDHQQGLADYLSAFQVTQQRLYSLSAELYVFRMEVERYLRPKTGSKLNKVGNFFNIDIERRLGLNSIENYFKLLDTLDNALRVIHEQFNTTNIDWLRKTELLAPNTEIIKASCCLLTLLSPPIQALENNIAWAAHTAYCPDRTEAKIAYEIERRKITPTPYSLRTTYTQTDYLINHRLPQDLRTSRAKMVDVDTNKFQTEPLLLPIANFGTQAIDNLRKKGLALTRAWRLSQWFDPSMDADVAPALIDETDDALVANIVDSPNEALMLGVLVLHQEYIDWIKTQQTAAKSNQCVRLQDKLYDGPDELFHILIYQRAKVQYPRVEADIARMKKEGETLIRKVGHADTVIQEKDAEIQEKDAEIQEKDAEIQEKDAEIQEKDAELLSEKNKHKLLIMGFINMEIDEYLTDVSPVLSKVAIEQLTKKLSIKLTKAFSLTVQESTPYVSECLTCYQTKQAPTAPSVAKNPAGMYTIQPPVATAFPEVKISEEDATASMQHHK